MKRRLSPDAIITYGAGNHALWGQRFLTHHSYPSLVAPRNGAMRFGLPAVVAAAIAQPTRQGVSMTGHGCFLMNAQELSPAVTHGAKPQALVVDNNKYGTIRQHQERVYPGRVSGTDLRNPDFAAVARSFGAFAQTVLTTKGFSPALDEALASERAAILNLLVDPDLLEPTYDS